MMQVELLAHTMITAAAEDVLKPLPGVDDADHLAELAGRDCYQSWDRPNPETYENADYVGKNLIGKEHFSVLEHATATLRFVGVSRSLTHELVRHRHFSFSQLSQRYVDLEGMDRVIPPLILSWPDEEEREDMMNHLLTVWETAGRAYEFIEDTLVNGIAANGSKVNRKEGREAARAVLPNMTATTIVVTGNHRAWREFLNKRMSPHADAEIQEVAERVLTILLDIAPNSYQDFAVMG